MCKMVVSLWRVNQSEQEKGGQGCRDGLLEVKTFGHRLEDMRMKQFQQRNSPEAKILLGTFCETAWRGLRGWSRKGEVVREGVRWTRSRSTL